MFFHYNVLPTYVYKINATLDTYISSCSMNTEGELEFFTSWKNIKIMPYYRTRVKYSLLYNYAL